MHGTRMISALQNSGDQLVVLWAELMFKLQMVKTGVS